MRKMSLVSTLLVLILVTLESVLPTSLAHAGEPMYITIFVNNKSGGPVDLSLVIDGYKTYYHYDEGQYKTVVPEGRYNFYVVTPCGVQGGFFNLNRSKKLDIFCAKEGREIKLYNTFPERCEMLLKVHGYLMPSRSGKVYEGKVWYYVINYPLSWLPTFYYAQEGYWDCKDGVSPILDFGVYR